MELTNEDIRKEKRKITMVVKMITTKDLTLMTFL